MPLRAILFDKDGTLVDFNATWGAAIERVMRRMAEGDAGKFERLAAFNHYDLARRQVRPTSPLIAGSSSDYGPDWAAILGVEPTPHFLQRMDALCGEEVLHSLVPIGKATQIVAELAAQGLLIGVITNDSEASTRAQCDRLGLSPYLAGVIGYDSGHGRKPEAGQVLAFLKNHAIAPHEAALVGDTLHDLVAAKAAGVMGVAVLSGFVSQADIEAQADHVIASIDDLPALLADLGGPVRG